MRGKNPGSIMGMMEQKLGQLLGREPRPEELMRIHKAKDLLQISDNDALWDILIILEYHKSFYEQIPGRLAEITKLISEGMEVTAKHEVEKAQGVLAQMLAQTVVEQAKGLAKTLDMSSLIMSGTILVVALCAFGSLTMWFGYSLGSGQTHPAAAILAMPAGYLLGALCLPVGIFAMAQGAVTFSTGSKAWTKYIPVAVVSLLICCLFIVLSK